MSDDPRFPDGVVELRVHGVGGESPDNALGFDGDAAYPPAEHIAGDHIAGFYTKQWDGKQRHRSLEAYSWGGLTSRAGVRSLWLLLLPFSIVNTAGWMVEPRPEAAPHPSEPSRKPEGGDVTRAARVQFALIRSAALTMTALFVAWFGTLFVDLVAFQCGGQTTCTAGRWWMSPFTIDSVAAFPARRMAVGALIPLLFILLLFVLSYRARNRYEEYPHRIDHLSEFGEDGARLTDRTFWRSSAFVSRATYMHVGVAVATVGWLFALAVQELTNTRAEGTTPILIALGLYAVFVLVITWTTGDEGTDHEPSSHKEWHAYWFTPLGLTGAALVIGWVSGPNTPPTEVAAPGSLEPVFGRGPLFLGLAMLLVIVAMFLVRFIRWYNDPIKVLRTRLIPTVLWLGLIIMTVTWQQFPWVTSTWSFAIAGVMAAAIIGAGWITARTSTWRFAILLVAAAGIGLFLWGRAAQSSALQWSGMAVAGLALLPTLSAQFGRQDRWRWGAPLIGVGLGLLALMVSLAGSLILARDFLNRGQFEACCDPATPEIAVLPIYELVALLLVGSLAFAAIGAVLHLVRIRLDVWSPMADTIADEYADEPAPEPVADFVDCAADGDGAVVQQAVFWRSVSTAFRDVDVLISLLVMVPLVASVVALGRLALNADGVFSVFLNSLEYPVIPADWSAAVATAAWVASLFPLVGVIVVRMAIRNASTRRLIGIAWDVLTFWPRRFHPLAPPSYAERAVPELQARLRQLAAHEDRRVVVTAHSQGAIIATAALAGLRGSARKRIYLVTHGNPGGRLYRRFFPGYFGGGLMRWLRDRLGSEQVDGWLNLHRLTDPIGDVIFTGPDEDIGHPAADPDLGGGDRLLRDPATRWRFSLDDCPAAEGHSRYLRQAEAVVALDTIAAAVSPDASPGAADR